MDPHDLPHRAAECVRDALDGKAVILKIHSEDERAEAQRLVGTAPVIIATGAEALAFLQTWMPELFGARPSGRRRKGEVATLPISSK
jgi:hypothetical protein